MNAGVSSEKEKVKESQSPSVTPSLDTHFGCLVGGVTYTYTEWLSRSLYQTTPTDCSTFTYEDKVTYLCLGTCHSTCAALVHIRPNANHQQSPFQLVLGQIPNLSHLRVFGCTVQVPIATPQRTKMGPQHRSRIYIGFDSPSIIKYLEPLT